MNSLISIENWCAEMVYGPDQVSRISSLTNLLHAPMAVSQLMERKDLLSEVDILFSGWGGPVLDSELMSLTPNLKLYLHAGGAWKGMIGPQWYDSDVVFCSSVSLNGLPVAEYTLGFILIGLKRALPMNEWVKRNRDYPSDKFFHGIYGSTVGLVALGHSAQHLIRMLKMHDLKILAYDPYIDPNWADAFGIEMVELDTLFERSDVVSVHLPSNRKTRGMISGKHIRMMKELSTFINTSRGQVLQEEDVLETLQERTDIHAVFDVAIKEPPKPESLFFSLPNITLTPHIAGSMFKECERLSNAMIDDCERFMSGQPLKYEVSREHAQVLIVNS